MKKYRESEDKEKTFRQNYQFSDDNFYSQYFYYIFVKKIKSIFAYAKSWTFLYFAKQNFYYSNYKI